MNNTTHRFTTPILRWPLMLLSVLAAVSCAAGGQALDDGFDRVDGLAFPNGYEGYTKVNAKTIVRQVEDDEGQLDSFARELYASVVGDLSAGTTLVKERYALKDGRKSNLEWIAVMRRTGADARNGWSFEAYDPVTHLPRPEETATCVSCHSLQSDQDYLFTERSALRR